MNYLDNVLIEDIWQVILLMEEPLELLKLAQVYSPIGLKIAQPTFLRIYREKWLASLVQTSDLLGIVVCRSPDSLEGLDVRENHFAEWLETAYSYDQVEFADWIYQTFRDPYYLDDCIVQISLGKYWSDLLPKILADNLSTPSQLCIDADRTTSLEFLDEMTELYPKEDYTRYFRWAIQWTKRKVPELFKRKWPYQPEKLLESSLANEKLDIFTYLLDQHTYSSSFLYALTHRTSKKKFLTKLLTPEVRALVLAKEDHRMIWFLLKENLPIEGLFDPFNLSSLQNILRRMVAHNNTEIGAKLVQLCPTSAYPSLLLDEEFAQFIQEYELH